MGPGRRPGTAADLLRTRLRPVSLPEPLVGPGSDDVVDHVMDHVHLVHDVSADRHSSRRDSRVTQHHRDGSLGRASLIRKVKGSGGGVRRLTTGRDGPG